MCALNASSHRLTVANQMLSLVGSIQPDPFSLEHIPQTKPDRAAQSPQPSPRLLSEPVESEGLDETIATREEEEETLAMRGKKKREKEKEKGKVEKTKRKRKEDNAMAAKSERKSKRKKTS